MPSQSQVFVATNQSPNSENKKSPSKYTWKKILLAIILAFVTVGFIIGAVVVIFPQVPAIVLLKMEFPESKVPGAYNRLIHREVKPTETTKNTKEFKYCGVEFNTTGINFIKDVKPPPESEVEGCIAILEFSNESRIVIDTTTSVDYVAEFQGDSPEDAEKIKTIFGEELLESNYKFSKEVLNSNINEVTIFTSKNEVISKSILFILKTIYVSGYPSESGIYSFELPNVNGFQYGNPEVSDKVGLVVFDEQSKKEITLFVVGQSQEQIDFILNSIEIIGE